ncbi:MAG: PLP-dependent aminotransferase family protein [Planctomycetota bacterium]|nr:MAG: PLP-dependent aminotransferase family protein [Planctomycetota bacterium]
MNAGAAGFGPVAVVIRRLRWRRAARLRKAAGRAGSEAAWSRTQAGGRIWSNPRAPARQRAQANQPEERTRAMSEVPHMPDLRFSQRRRWAADQAIAYLMQQAVENPDVLSLAAGLVDDRTLPAGIVREVSQRLLADDAVARRMLQYGTTAGSTQARRAVLGHLARLEGAATPAELGVSLENVVLTTGSQQLLSLVCEVLLDPGDICLVAAPTYFVFLGTLAGVGARAVSVPSDSRGMIPGELDRLLADLEKAGELPRAKLVYVVSYYENPSGVSLAAERRRALLEVVQRYSHQHRIMVLEDAAYRELRYDGPQLPSVWSCDESRRWVILAQTFSKSFSPGLRVGYGVMPEELARAVCDRKGNEDFGSANFNQLLIAEVLAGGRYEEHVEGLRRSYRAKRDAMLAAAERYFADLPVRWHRPDGGLYVWMTLPEHVETGFESPLFRRATQVDRVMYVPGELSFAGPKERRPRNHLRLSFGVLQPPQIEEAMRRLAAAVRATLAES